MAWLRLSYDAEHPTQYRYSTSLPGSRIGTSSPSAQANRSGAGRPQGFPARSMFWSDCGAVDGRAPSDSVRKRRRSTIVSTMSMKAGHSCTQAMHVVQAHSSSALISSPWMGPGLFASQVALELDDDLLGRERRPRQVGRTGVLAAPALQAGLEVEPALPRELLELRDAEGALLGRLLDVQRSAPGPPAAPAWRRRC